MFERLKALCLCVSVFALFIGITFLYSCDDMHDINEVPDTGSISPETGTAEFYILSEGLFNLNNSTLARYTFHDNKIVSDYFLNINRRSLGDTANNMDIYGSKLYIVVNVSSQIEVIDIHSGISLKRIPLLTENGSSRQPRNIAFHKGKAYVCSFDGTVARIDTTTLSIDKYVSVGRNPDGICVQNNKLYVSNSGGLDNPDYDNTVSVIDIPTFSEIKKITVGSNPGKILSDNYGYVYVAVRGDLTAYGNKKFIQIDSQTDEVHQSWNKEVLDFTISDEFAYLFNYNHQTKQSTIQVFNLSTGQTEQENFITDGTVIQTPFSITVNPYSSNVYITDAYDYKVKGDVLCFNPQGQLQFRLNNVGLNPNTIVFSDKLSQSIIDDAPENPNAPTAFATKVLEYRPAPSQFMNTITTAYREGFGYDKVLELASEQIKKRSLLTLGAYGGSITIGFNQTIRNIEGEYDFKIYGNASWSSQGNGSSEPGIVFVSKDSNSNGLPDDEWYEIAGSEYASDKAIRDYEITYYRPASSLDAIQWTDNKGNEGTIPRNSFHKDNSYYPAWIEEDQLTFRGTRLPDNGVQEGSNWVQYPYAWGYADNQANNTEHCQFKIDWAVDKEGKPVKLDGIDFIRIYTAVNQVCGWMGESSTEISTIEDLHFNN
ncbi:YncE family protein [Bacteroides sp. 519]|nr:YncE family protein [Bacteroides sp. 519]